MTLDEVVEKHGVSIKVRREEWDKNSWFFVFGKAPDDTYVGYDESGESYIWEEDEQNDDGDHIITDDWDLYSP